MLTWNRKVDQGSSEDASDTVDAAIKYKSRGVVGLDWCGNPEVGNFDTFKSAFERARQAGLAITLHFGEVNEPENVKQIVQFRPERVGHATVLDGAVVSELLENPIPIEICYTSNLLCGTVTEGNKHHFGEYYSRSSKTYPLAISTDDKGVFDSDLSNEYLLVAQSFQLDRNEIIELARQTTKLIFDNSVQSQLQQKIDEFAAENRSLS